MLNRTIAEGSTDGRRVHVVPNAPPMSSELMPLNKHPPLPREGPQFKSIACLAMSNKTHRQFSKRLPTEAASSIVVNEADFAVHCETFANFEGQSLVKLA